MELYLTKMVLNPHSRRVQFEIGNLQELHKTVSAAFPAVESQAHLPHHERETPRVKFDVLYRLDVDYRANRAALLVQSTVKPVWNHLRGNFLAEEVEENLAVKSIGDVYARLENGMKLRFRLRANPTKRVGANFQYPDESKREAFARKFRDEKNRRRISLNSDGERIEWLKRKGDEAGFRLAQVQIKPVENAVAIGQGKIQARRGDGKLPMTFGATLFDGVLEVTDAGKFREALQKGIGTGKAYGFGLLSIAKSKNV
jgi:CRISPR system Cascade subunit CasE